MALMMDSSCDEYEDDSKSMIERLPEELLEKFFSYLTFEGVSNIRGVCSRFNHVCQKLLNQGFARADKFHALCQKEIKSRLPRRESERRQHALARHAEILSAIETRLSLLGMTYMKYIDTGMCCFIPGKVLDEIFSVLLMIRDEARNGAKPPRAHEILQELRDISSMAMEHFDEKVVPILKQRMTPTKMETFINDALESTPGPSYTPQASISFSVPTPHIRFPPIRHDVQKVQHQVRVCGTNVISLRKEVSDSKSRLNEHKKRLTEQDAKIVNLNKKLARQAKKINDQDQRIVELSRKIIDYDAKFTEITAQVSTLRGDKLKLSASGSGDFKDTEHCIDKRRRKRPAAEAAPTQVAMKTRRR